MMCQIGPLTIYTIIRPIACDWIMEIKLDIVLESPLKVRILPALPPKKWIFEF